MDLKEAVDRIISDPSGFSPSWRKERSSVPTVFARRIEEHFHPESEAIIVDMDSDEVFKRCRSQGLDYFLEVFLVRELLEEWKTFLKSHPGDMPPLEALIHYAENDAFPY